jgi:hypothetical protein
MITLHTLPRYALFFIFSISFSILSAQLNVSPTASVTDGGTYPELDGARGITTVVIGEKTYALVAAFSDDGVQIMELVDPSFSAEEILANTVLLYPNPAKSQLQVEYTQPTQTQYTIYALTGQVVGQSHHREAHHTINVSHLSSGTYLLQAKSDKGEKYYHFIKE